LAAQHKTRQYDWRILDVSLSTLGIHNSRILIELNSITESHMK